MQELKKKHRKKPKKELERGAQKEQKNLTDRTVESEYRDCSFGKHDKGDSDCDESAVVYVSSVILISGNLAS